MPLGAISTDTTTLLQQWLTILRAGSTQGFLADIQSQQLGKSGPLTSIALNGPGSVADPAISLGSPAAGFYQVLSNNVGASINGSLVFDWNATRVKFAQPVQLPDGTVAAPSLTFSGQTTTGFIRPGSGLVDYVAASYSATLAAIRFSGGAGIILGNGLELGFTGSSGAAGTVDTTLLRGGAAMQLVFGNQAAAGGATSLTSFLKATTAIADNVATAVLTITLPNSVQSGSLRVRICGSLGAGGAIGANEASGTVTYDIGLTRTAGVNAVGTISTAYGSGMASVAGAATMTMTAVLSAVSGAVGVANTFTVNVTIARGSGSSTNHTAVVEAALLNANASGITLS